MKKLLLWTCALAACPIALFAQNITGSWQGTLQDSAGASLAARHQGHASGRREPEGGPV